MFIIPLISLVALLVNDPNGIVQNAQAPGDALMVSAVPFAAIILYVIPSMIIFGSLYKKADKPVWAVAVPIYAEVVMAQIARKPVWWGIVLGILGAIPAYVSGFLLSIVFLVVYIRILIAFAGEYNKGLGTWLVFIFVPFIGEFIVNRVRYVSKNADFSYMVEQARAEMAAEQAANNFHSDATDSPSK